ncbi:transglycosylase domain-containing protein [Lacticaseibacillus parakribbianus]|uniref:transglycosylase domain-containing protein n=1 Tax=Lacticaseibacillus parakribbianus TaxID=2970927 RepID=UPI0021CB4C4E|nr:transglycosylase domain-containing protein [Lacticaseibacillus parakribbianus]
MANQAPSRMAKRRQKPAKKAKKRGGRWLRFFKFAALAVVVALAAGIGLFAYYAKDAPAITKTELMSGGGSTLYASNNKALTHLGVENRVYATADKIPQRLKDAVVSIEDRRFYKEKFGVDPIRIAGAAFANLKAKVTGNTAGLQGGSTLTQQLVKLSVFSTKVSDQTLRRKAQEAWLAVKVERSYSKEQILEFYINKVYMNYGQRGMATGAQFYYGKSLSQLDLAQTAFIAGLAQSPSGYDPYVSPARATTRRNAVLDAMLRDNKITQAQAATAKAEAISTGLKKKSEITNTALVDKVIDAYLTQVIKQVKAKLHVDPYAENLKIYTNLDYNVQKKLYEIVNDGQDVVFPDNKIQTAVTMTNPQTGAVVAQIGGRKTGNVRLAYNRATQNDRSNGSTMKPLMDYAPAIEYLNYSTATMQSDTPYNYPGTNTPLYDIDHKYMGTMTIRRGLELSRNIIAIKTLEAVGLTKSLNFIKGLGITLPANQQVYPSGIGASVTTEQEAAAYGALANGGTYYKPSYVKKVVTPDGDSVTFQNAGTRAMKSSTAYMVTDMLKGVIAKGTGMAAQISGLYQAGKTGTTDYAANELAANAALKGTAKDSWMVGYTRYRVASVWLGYDKANTAGVTTAMQLIPKEIYKVLMTYASSSLPNKDWVKPESVIAKTVNGSRELYVRGFAPTTPAVSSSSSSSVSSSVATTSSATSSSVLSSSSSSASTSSVDSSSDSESSGASDAGSTPATESPSNSVSLPETPSKTESSHTTQ